MNKVKYALTILLLASVVIIGGVYSGVLWRNKITIKVLHAGSLTLPLEEIKSKFERDFSSYRPPGSFVVYYVEVLLEPAGSVQCIRKIIDIGERADVLAVADFSLIPKMMMPNYADWYIKFAKNRMVLAYTEHSKYANEVNSSNWFNILRREDVRWGFSNPNMDPCGYRTPWVIQLAEFEYNDDQIFEDLIEANSAIRMFREGDNYVYVAPEDLQPNTERLVIRDKSVELVALLESGGLDYAFEYLSVAIQHNLKYVLLPESIDLSSEEPEYIELYSRMRAVTIKGNITAGPIHYGVTIPKNAQHPELAAIFVKYMIDEFGRSVFENMGQPPIKPAIASEISKIPEILKPYCISEEE
ncbi:tungstate ABC transporter substrate-binding protein WtpA [Candidatus Bathyarchaeota archaeon]|nr:MAG: tungstate ABC transporter substrate-binding protein WtpA [Candidatus Bathyarchaeota archaeon]